MSLNKKMKVNPNPDPEAVRDIGNMFTKDRILLYIWIVAFPPYGLYQIWYGKSTLRRSEKWAWTMVVAAYVISFFRLIMVG